MQRAPDTATSEPADHGGTTPRPCPGPPPRRARRPRWRGLGRALLLWLAGLLATLPALAATYTNASTPYAWINPASHTKLGYNTSPYKLNGGGGCGTTPPVLDDTLSDDIPIGFAFVYGTTTYTSLRVQSNGRLQFGGNTTCGYGTAGMGPPQSYGLPYPDGSLNNSMRVFGADLDPTNLVDKPNYPNSTNKTSCASISSCFISVATIGTAPRRQFVVTWNQVPEWVSASNTSGSFTVQIILNEDGSFIYQYNSINHGGDGTAQVGWQISTSDYTVLTFGAAAEPSASTAIKFYIAAAVLADYRFEEGAWATGVAGQVRDSSGNGFHGTAMGLAQSDAAGHVCRGLKIEPNSEGGNVYGVDSGLPMNDARTNLLGTGVVMMWVKLDDAWSGAGARNAQLLDASTVNGDWFQLTKRSDGTVRLTITDSTGVLRVATTPAFNYAAGTWQHVAIYWSFNGNPGSGQDYVGVVVNAGTLYFTTFTTDGTAATTLGNLFIGDNPLGLSATGHSVNSASGVIDDVKVLNYTPSNAQFLSLKGASHACDTYTLNHLELRHDTWSGVGCSPATITVLACADSSFPCSNAYTKGAVVTLSASGATATWIPSGDATVVLPYGSGSATKQFYIAPGTATLGAGASPAASAATRCNDSGNACQWTSNTSGLVLSAPTVTGGKLTAVTVQAVSSSGTSCSSVSNAGNNLRLWAVPVSPASFAGYTFSAGTLVGGPPTAAANSFNFFPTVLPQGDPGYDNVSGLSFDASSKATLYLKYMNTGSFTLSARLDTNAPVQTLLGNTVVNVLPAGLAVVPANARVADSNTQSACAGGPSSACDSAAAAAARTGSAGDSWSLQLKAALWTVDNDTDFSDNPVAPSFAATVALSPTLLAPQGGATGSLGVTSLAMASGTGSTTQSWTQSGALRVDASTTYLGSPVSGQSPALGRFSPKYLRTRLEVAGCGSFTYSGQPMTTVSVAAMDGAATPDVTPNYSGAFARTVTLSDASGAAGSLSANSIAAAAFSSGLALGTATASPVFKFSSKQTAPATLQLRASDGEVSSAGVTGAEATALQRSGRLRLSNAFGSAAGTLQLPLVVEYWAGNTWQLSSGDSCTTLSTANVVLTNPRTAAGAVSTASSSVTAVSLSGGNGLVTLAAPSPAGSSLSLDLALNLGSTTADQACTTSHPASTGAARAWLRSAWGNCAATADRDPAARASFGVFSPETKKTVHVRELY